ncbi:MAG: TIGR04283 family arsenosugar biosynthesis glycosyltransferase [Bacteroidota bacterium]
MTISVIIPTLNEEINISVLIGYLKSCHDQQYLREIIVVDGGSTDHTISAAQQFRALVINADRGRAVQMNAGARVATGDILYFIHADVRPPLSCFSDIIQAVKERNCIGCFAYRFDSKHLLLKANSFFTQFDWVAVGGGDQTLFLLKHRFEELGGFDETLPIMEDFDFFWRAKKKYPIRLINKKATVSARKYKHNSYFKVQLVNAIAFTAFRWGVSPSWIAGWYKRRLG